MNKFDELFFWKYVRDGDEPLEVCHRHVILIIDTMIVWMFFGVIIPAFFYYNNTFQLQQLIPFMYVEWYLILIYIILMYKIFDWYNDVWILTDRGLIDLDWTAFKKNIVYVEFGDIKWIEIQENSMWDSALNKGTIQLYLEWEDDPFSLEWAYAPAAIVSYIQNYIEDKAKKKKDGEKKSFEVLLDTLQKVVKNHLEHPTYFNEEGEEENEEEKNHEVEKALKKKGTIDLRGE